MKLWIRESVRKWSDGGELHIGCSILCVIGIALIEFIR